MAERIEVAYIGRFIREARERAGKAIREVAPDAAITAQTWSNVELGRRRVTPETISRMLAALGYTSSGPFYEVSLHTKAAKK